MSPSITVIVPVKFTRRKAAVSSSSTWLPMPPAPTTSMSSGFASCSMREMVAQGI